MESPPSEQCEEWPKFDKVNNQRLNLCALNGHLIFLECLNRSIGPGKLSNCVFAVVRISAC